MILPMWFRLVSLDKHCWNSHEIPFSVSSWYLIRKNTLWIYCFETTLEHVWIYFRFSFFLLLLCFNNCRTHPTKSSCDAVLVYRRSTQTELDTSAFIDREHNLFIALENFIVGITRKTYPSSFARGFRVQT